MLSTLRERLTLALLALLPLHALGVTVLTRVFAGPNQAPLSMIAVWKEALLLLILIVAVIEIGRRIAGSGWRVAGRKFDALDVCIVIALLYSVLIHPWATDTAMTSYIYGFRYDFVPLVSFLVLRRVSWSTDFMKNIRRVLLVLGTLVAGYGCISIFLPDSWFMTLGYSALHSLYIPDGPIAAFQYISETGLSRIQSTFSGPNQLGLWLLLPLSFSFGYWRIREAGSGWRVAVSALLLFVILLTFSRSAWIGAGVVGLVMLGPVVARRVLTLGVLVIIIVGVTAATMFPSVFVRSLSTSAHITRPLHALALIKEKPLGHGLGSAGPASNRTSDACVELPAGGDATWAEPFPNLCVFVGGTQVQPVDRACNCPVVTENWYLQWGVEMGLLGLLVSLLLPFFVLRKLIMNNEQLIMMNVRRSITAAFLGISVAALFLHAFEDSAVSYSLWILLSGTLPLWRVQQAASSS